MSQTQHGLAGPRFRFLSTISFPEAPGAHATLEQTCVPHALILQGLGYTLVAWTNLSEFGAARMTWQGPSFSFLSTIPFPGAPEAHQTLKQTCVPHEFQLSRWVNTCATC